MTMTSQILGRHVAPVLPHKLSHGEELLKWQTIFELATDIELNRHTLEDWKDIALNKLAILRSQEMRMTTLPGRKHVNGERSRQGA